MSLFRPRKTLHVHFPTFLLSAFVARKVAVFVSKTYAFRPQDLWFWAPRALSDGGKSYGLGD